jgi:nucleoside-diphosphate-sugar epimerase
MTHPLPPDIGSFEYIMHAASIASPTYYRQHPIQTMDANVNGLRNLLDYFRRRKQRGLGVEGFRLFLEQRDLRRSRSREYSTPETYRGLVSCTGPRACYDEAKRYGETLCVNFAQQFDLPVKIVRPVQQLRPGLEDHRWPRDSRLRARRARGAGHRDALRWLRDANVLLRRRCGRGILQGSHARPRGEAYNIGTEEPEISVADLAIKIADIARESIGYTAKSSSAAATTRIISSTIPTRAARSSRRRASTSASSRKSSLKTVFDAR